MMIVSNITDQIFHVLFPAREDLAETFLRPQEHYESPKFRRKIFTQKEFKEWYIENSPNGQRTGQFTYAQDFPGFNIPSSALKPFYEGKFNPLLEAEQMLLEHFNRLWPGGFYIIGTAGDQAEGLRHETAHGFLYTCPDYREEQLMIVNQLKRDIRKQINRYLASTAGYHRAVWRDETHGHIMTLLPELMNHGIAGDGLMDASERLNGVFDRYAAQLVSDRYAAQLALRQK